MSKLTKEEVSQWIRNLIPYLENPMVLAPKGCFQGQQDVCPGKIIEYDAALMPITPKNIKSKRKYKSIG